MRTKQQKPNALESGDNIGRATTKCEWQSEDKSGKHASYKMLTDQQGLWLFGGCDSHKHKSTHTDMHISVLYIQKTVCAYICIHIYLFIGINICVYQAV